ncbi:methyltransferase domain-containing protein [Cordyceps javanica]|nr:methyltransferase domain-containing protein [Cordyceps javanica]
MVASEKTPSFTAEDPAIPFSLAQEAWASYKEHRPEYPQSMFDRWYDYHRAHGGKFDTAHDVGAGGGILSAKLAQSFAHVVVSDPGASNLALARSALQPASRFTFHLGPGEASWLPAASVDLVAYGESLHWMDTRPALAAAAASLRPGGTVAAVFYGLVLYFPQDSRLTDLMRATQVAAYRQFFADVPALQHDKVRSAPGRCMRGFNSLALPDDEVSTAAAAAAGDGGGGGGGGGGAFRDWTRVNVNLHGRGDLEAFRWLPEEEFDSRLTDLMRATQVAAYRQFFADVPALQHDKVRSAPGRCMRGFNSLALPDDEVSTAAAAAAGEFGGGGGGGGGAFRDWTRVNVNLHGRGDLEAFRWLPEEEFPVEDGRVREDRETVLEIEDESWGRDVDVAWVKGFLASLAMPYDQRCWDLPPWVEFERIINDEFGGTVRAEWPVSLLMGSKI